MQLGLLRNNKLDINISVLTVYHQAICKILREKIKKQKAYISCQNPHVYTMKLLLAALLNQFAFFLRLAIPALQSTKSLSMWHEMTL
jgi:hypothetical protein